MVDETDSEDVGSTRERIATCTHTENLDIIPLSDMFISHQYDKLKKVNCNDHDWDVKLTLHRRNGRKLAYTKDVHHQTSWHACTETIKHEWIYMR